MDSKTRHQLAEKMREINPFAGKTKYKVLYGSLPEWHIRGYNGLTMEIHAKCEKDARALAEEYAEAHGIEGPIFAVFTGLL